MSHIVGEKAGLARKTMLAEILPDKCPAQLKEIDNVLTDFWIAFSDADPLRRLYFMI